MSQLAPSNLSGLSQPRNTYFVPMRKSVTSLAFSNGIVEVQRLAFWLFQVVYNVRSFVTRVRLPKHENSFILVV